MIDFSQVKGITVPQGEVKSISQNGIVLWKKSRLPDAYQEVEWIGKSTSGQYLVFSPPINVRLAYNAKYLLTSLSSVFGASGNLNPTGSSQRIRITGIYGPDDAHITASLNFTDAITDAVQDGVFYHSSNSFTETYAIKNVIVNNSTAYSIMARNGTGNDASSQGSRIYYLEIFNFSTNEMYFNFIPCYRIADGEIGMYDLVGNEFYTNQGTGTFVKGEDV